MKIKLGGDIEEDPGILYVALFELEGKDLVKIGITRRTVERRMSDILVSIFKRYRVFPRCVPKRFRKVGNVLEKESILHKYFSNFKYVTEHKFSGSTEFFDISLDDAVEAYEKLLAGESLDEIREDWL